MIWQVVDSQCEKLSTGYMPIVTEELPDFSVTMAVFALKPQFCYIDTEKMACFCGTMIDGRERPVRFSYDISEAIRDYTKRSGPPRGSGAYPYAPAPRAAAALTEIVKFCLQMSRLRST